MTTAKIDVHAHFIPPFYEEALRAAGLTSPDGLSSYPPWTAESHIAAMDRAHISRSVLSLSSPGTFLKHGDAAGARALAKRCNDFAMEIAKAHPDRFSFFATLPLPDVEGSLQEIDRALDDCNAVGFVMLTNHQGVYLGDPKLEPVFAKLNERKAVVFVHPTTAMLCQHDGSAPIPANPLPSYTSPMMEFFFDTARGLEHLMLTGTAEKYPNIRYIVSHAGGCLPPLLDRIVNLIPSFYPSAASLTHETVSKLLRTRLFFDLCGGPFPNQIRGLLPHTSHTQLMFGTDYPWGGGLTSETQAERFEKGVQETFGKELIWDLASGNAQRLLQIK